MIFDYSNPITGLNYQSVDTLVILDIDKLPKTQTKEEIKNFLGAWKEWHRKSSFQLIDSTKEQLSSEVEYIGEIITNDWVL